jgi:hypothetical protein
VPPPPPPDRCRLGVGSVLMLDVVYLLGFAVVFALIALIAWAVEKL